MLPRPDTPLDQLRAAWDAKAERDALHASCPTQSTWTDAEFLASGAALVTARFAPAMASQLAEARRLGTPLRVLDFGCGAGRLLGALRAMDPQVAVRRPAVPAAEAGEEACHYWTSFSFACHFPRLR